MGRTLREEYLFFGARELESSLFFGARELESSHVARYLFSGRMG